MRKKIERTTTNMMFLCEANVNIENEALVKLPDSKIELKVDKKSVRIYKDGEPLDTNIVDFKSMYSEMVNGLSTIDFWTSDFLKEIAENQYYSKVSLSNAISSVGKRGYILETIISFPKESKFYIKWNEERTRKGEVYMRSLTNF